MVADNTEKSYAEEMDAKDPMSHYRDAFHLPKQRSGEPAIYFLGNSLGLQPKTARKFLEARMSEWEQWGVEAYNQGDTPWIRYPDSLVNKMAPIMGAKPAEVALMNALTVNLHLMLVSFYRPTQGRVKILMGEKPFPSDEYAVKSQMRFHGINPDSALMKLKARPGETFIRTEDIDEVLEHEGDSIALVLLEGVSYLSGQFLDLEHITKVGHERGCVVGFDLAHAAGNVLLQLHDWQVDFAVWCTYKYLNGGPGGPGGCFVHEMHKSADALPRFEGWWGNKLDTRFLMQPDINPIQGADGWQISSGSPLILAPLQASLELFEKATMVQLREKSVYLTGYLEFLLNQIESDQFSIITPSDPKQRGCQLSIRTHSDGKRLHERLTQAGIFCDWREPDVIRVAPVPFYNSFTEVYNFANVFEKLSALR